MASGGPLYLTGDADRAPLRVSAPQAFHFAAAEAAVAALVAHLERERSGRGQHVDVSAQQALGLATLYRILDAPWGQAPAERSSGRLQLGKLFMRMRFPTRDGWVVLGPGFLPSTGPFLTRLVQWLYEERLLETSATAARTGAATASGCSSVRWSPSTGRRSTPALERLFAARTNLEILREAVARKLLVAPSLTADGHREPRALPRARLPARARAPGAGRARALPGPVRALRAQLRSATGGSRRGSASTPPRSSPSAARRRGAARARRGARASARGREGARPLLGARGSGRDPRARRVRRHRRARGVDATARHDPRDSAVQGVGARGPRTARRCRARTRASSA